LLDDAHVITEATGTLPPGYIEPVLAAYRGDKDRTLNLVRASTDYTTVYAEGQMIPMVHFAAAVLHVGLGEYPEALAATELAVQHDDLGLGGYALVQRIEAAARLGEVRIAAEALDQLIARTEPSGTDLALGLAARSRALLASGPEAEGLYQEAIAHLERTGITILLARAKLIYGEWLRRENRRNDARDQLRRAHSLFVKARADGFAERTRRELVATGDSVRMQDVGPSDSLTGQESVIARLARDGHTNQEIAEQLFISPRTVEWHMSRIFDKLQIRSRRGLRAALRAST
jgi:DNA-binding CsgD family transcriptional regulator